MIRLVEYRTSRVHLADQDLEYLLPMVKGTGEASDDNKVIESITPAPGGGHQYLVRPGGFVGRLGLPSGEWIDIHSRFPFEDVIEVILRSRRLPLRVDQLEAPAGVEPFFIDILAAGFVREVNRLVGQGLAKGYERHRFERPPYPGQIDINRHLSRYAARPDQLVTSARRITHDIDANRALALALDVLHRLRLQAEIAHGVGGLRPSFARVRRTPMGSSAISRIPLTRLTTRYEAAQSLAELIIGSQALAPRSESRSGASVLFNMPKVWEAFVARWIEDEWGDEYRIEAPHSFDLTAGGALRSEADVTVWQDGKLAALYDAKYKWPGTTPTMTDVYQMVTYCTKLGIDEATLVYPGSGHSRSFDVSGVRVRMRSLSVTVDQAGSAVA